MTLLILSILVCLALSFFFSGSETAVISINRYRLRSLHEQGDPEAGRVIALLSNTQRLLIMALIGTNIANVLAALLFRMLMEKGIVDPDARALGAIRWSELLSLALLTPVLIVFAEILPKALFRAHADRLAAPLRPIYVMCLWVFHPAIWMVERIARWMLGPLTVARSRAMRRLTRQDVIQLVRPEDQRPEESRSEGNGQAKVGAESATGGAGDATEAGGAEIDGAEERVFEESDERRMVENILKLNQTTAEEIMTPLVELEAVRLGQVDLDALRKRAIESGYSRFPVFRDRIVHIVGFIDIFRVLKEFDGSQTLPDFIERPHYVPETKRIDDLLQEFLDKRIKIAIVVDEFGGCSGLISREDIFEEIVGEMEDELDEPAEPIQQAADGTITVDGRIEIDRLNVELAADLSDDDWETIAGLVLHEMGRIPKVGDQVILDDWHATVVEMDGLRIARIALRRVEE
jgi:CBS domain containing-hemolysin-like protein